MGRPGGGSGEHRRQTLLPGAEPTALDLYMAVMTTWHSRPAWFREYCSKLHAVAALVARIA